METVIYVVVGLAVGYAVGRFSVQPRAVLQIVVDANSPTPNLGDIWVSKARADRIQWTMTGNEVFTGVLGYGLANPPTAARPYLNPKKVSPTLVDSGSLNPAVSEGDQTPYTLPGSNRTYTGRMIIQR